MKLKSRPAQTSIEIRVLPELLSRVEACGEAEGLLLPECVGTPIVAACESTERVWTADAQGVPE